LDFQNIKMREQKYTTKEDSENTIELKSIVFLIFGLLFGLSVGTHILNILLSKVRGYRWDYIHRCVLEEKDEYGNGLAFCRSLVDCDICKDVSVVDEVFIDELEPANFETKYANPSRPLVIRNATSTWPVMHVLDYEWMKDLYIDYEDEVEESGKDCWFNNYNTKDIKTLRSLFSMSEERKNMEEGKRPWYVGWAVCHRDIAEVFYSLLKKPKFLRTDSTQPWQPWIFIGTPGHGADLHIDDVGASSWQAQITGVKTWYLEPPPECFWSCGGRMEVTLYPGDIIVVDANKWYHFTSIHNGALSISVVNEFD